MPVIATTAYSQVESILLDARALANDMEIAGGDILTDAAPFTMRFVNLAYRRIQSYLAQYGVETYTEETWLLNVPPNNTGDPESRVIISDSGTEIFTPSGAGESSYANPILPDDLVAPLKLRERPTGTTQFAPPMVRPNDGLTPYRTPFLFMRQWDWFGDALRFIGATQAMDLFLEYEKHLPILSLVTDAVPIRGVDNAAAYGVVFNFAKSRGSAIADGFGQQGQAELDLLANRAIRAKQRVRHRRQGYRSNGRGNCSYRSY